MDLPFRRKEFCYDEASMSRLAMKLVQAKGCEISIFLLSAKNCHTILLEVAWIGNKKEYAYMEHDVPSKNSFF